MPDPQLPGAFHALAPILDRHGYLAVGGLVFLEDFGVPVPGETVLIAAAIYAGAGRLDIALVALVAFAAAVVGDNVGYAIGHVGGRPLVARFGRYVFLTEPRIDKAQDWFSRHGAKVIVVARFVEGLRQANGFVAGISRMRWPTFLAANALGAALWVGVWSAVGYLAGSHIGAVYGPATHALLGLAAVVVIALVVRYVVRRRHRRSGAGSQAA